MVLKNSQGVFRPVFLLLLLFSAVLSPAQQAGPRSDTQALLTTVSELMGRREYARALELFDRLDASVLQTSEVQLLRAYILNSAGRFADARAIASGIISREPNNVDALLVLATAAGAEGKNREEKTNLEKVIKIDPKNLKALSDLGYIALDTSLSKAAGYFDRALAVDGNYREALVGRAMVYRYAGKPKQSEELFHRAVRQNPDWAKPCHERARLYRGAGFYEDALRDLNAAKKIEPDNYWISVDRAVTLLDLNRRQEALEELNLSVTLNPDHFLSYVYRAGLKDEAGDYAGAEQDYATLMRIKPDYFFAAEGLGIIKMKNKQYTQARDAFLAAYKQVPKEYRYALLAAVNWMKSGRPDDPKQFLAQVLRTAPRDSGDWHLLRLYHDLSGDRDVAARIDWEENNNEKSKMLFYLACYYDARGNTAIANNYFLEVKEMNCRSIIEWKINQMIIEERGMGNL